LYRGERIAGRRKGSSGWRKKEIMKEVEYRAKKVKKEVLEKGVGDVIENERQMNLKYEK
jgi:hypothetical protein